MLTRIIFFFYCTLIPHFIFSQTVSSRLSAAYQSFIQDAQMRNGLAALSVLDAATGKVIFEQNGSVGLAPASTLKIITSISAYELLGKNFRYETSFAYSGHANASALLVLPGGDPTLGSWRWKTTKEAVVLRSVIKAIKNSGRLSFSNIAIVNSTWENEAVPDNWLWQDIGNYYGAGAGLLNWRENQFDVILKSGKNIGDAVSLVRTVPAVYGYKLHTELTSAAPGTGDNAYIYFPLTASAGVIRGTIPVNQVSFKIAGAIPSPSNQLLSTLRDSLLRQNIKITATETSPDILKSKPENYTVLHTVTSPPLDSLVYWFNRKSINLYGEALLKTMAHRKAGKGATNEGIKLIKAFWQQKGIPETELNMADGSGLSPLNRVTTRAQVRLLLHAREQAWFKGFYASLPEFNGMKMKSGTTQGVKAYCGYYKNQAGKEYIFSFLVNNYNGSPGTLVQKMYKVLDVLK